MHIKSIYIERTQSRQKTVSLNLSALNISVLYGENGCGKTVLLRLLNAVLGQEDRVLADEKVQQIRIVYENDNRKEKEVRIICKEQAASDSAQITYDWSAFRASELFGMASILLCPNSGNASHINVSPDFLYWYIVEMGHIEHFRTGNDAQMLCDNLSQHIKLKQSGDGKVSFESQSDFSAPVLTIDTVDMHMVEMLLLERFHLAQQAAQDRVQKALFDILANACDSANMEAVDETALRMMLPTNQKKLIDILERLEKNALSDKIISILKSDDQKFIAKELKNNSLLAKLIVKMSSELEREETPVQSVNKLKDIFNAYIGPEKYIEISDDGIVIKFHSSPETHGIEHLSGGEQRLFILLTVFILEGDKRQLFLIDEPETSLNMKWQRGLMPLLGSLAPNAQIIAASHSPAIAEANVSYLVELK